MKQIVEKGFLQAGKRKRPFDNPQVVSLIPVSGLPKSRSLWESYKQKEYPIQYIFYKGL